MEIKCRSAGPLVNGKRTVAKRLGWVWSTSDCVTRDSGHRTLETLIQFVKFVKRGQVTASLGMEWNGTLETRHSPKHQVLRELMRVVSPMSQSLPSQLEVVGLLLEERQ